MESCHAATECSLQAFVSPFHKLMSMRPSCEKAELRCTRPSRVGRRAVLQNCQTQFQLLPALSNF